MKRLAIAVLLALFCVTIIQPVKADYPETPCKDGGVKAGHNVSSFGFGHVVPCGWKITLEGHGRIWRLASTGRIPLTIRPIGDGCAVKQLGIRPLAGEYIETARIKVTGATCTFDLRLHPPEDISGFVWFFFMWNANAQ